MTKTILGLYESDITAALQLLGRESDSFEEYAEAFSRATWSGISEPGDRVAGMLLRYLGAYRALDLLVTKTPASVIVQVLLSCVPDGDLDRDDLTRDIRDALERWRPRVNSMDALISLKHAAGIGARLLIPTGTYWPTGLGDLADHAPLALWTRGEQSRLMDLDYSMSIVGARASTGYGEHVTMEAVTGLVENEIAIVSGAAYGIDGMAHRSALAAGGMTMAFLAGGVDRFYPSGHDALLMRIVDRGVVLSEVPCGFAPTKWRFLQRNRLIAAASQATVVMEAGWRSGSINTANHAVSLVRPLGVVPGPVTSASSAGCHRLLRESTAICVTSVEEMVELMPERAEGTPRGRRTRRGSGNLEKLPSNGRG